MTDLAPDPTLLPIDAPDDQAELARRHRESLFPSVGLYYSEPIELRRGERQYVYDGAGRQYLDFFGGIVTVSSGHAIPEINEPIKANAAYKKAVALDPSYVSALVNLGVHQLRNKQYGDAVETFEKLTGQLGRNDAAVWSSLGSAYRGMSADFDRSASRDEWLAKAESSFKRSLAIDKNYGPAYYNLGLLYLDADPFPTSSETTFHCTSLPSSE